MQKESNHITIATLKNDSNNKKGYHQPVKKCQIRSNLRNSISNRKASLTPQEMKFLSALLLEPTTPTFRDDNHCEKHPQQQQQNKNKYLMLQATKVLENDMLFSLPFPPLVKSNHDADNDDKNNKLLQPSPPPPPNFKILTSSSPSCKNSLLLSPQLIKILLQHVPERFSSQNPWLKYSLEQHGAHLNILKRNVRTSMNTLIVIETTNGDVFGSFTSSFWHTQPCFFGTGEAFLWRLKEEEEEEKVEEEIDVYSYSFLNSYVQLCTSNRLAVGGGGDNGSGFSIDEDLMYGTSSPCDTFSSPCLLSSSSCRRRGGGIETFEIVNMEVWTFTPFENVSDAERLEMTKFFIREEGDSSVVSHPLNQ